MYFRIFTFLTLLLPAILLADPVSLRWTGKELSTTKLAPIVEKIVQETALPLSVENFTVLEDRDLSRYHFTTYSVVAGGVPVRGLSLRVWSDLKSKNAVQVEARVDSLPSRAMLARFSDAELSNAQTLALISLVVKNHPDDRLIQQTDWKDHWYKGQLVRIVTVKGRRGKHTIVLSVPSGRVVESEYKEFPQDDISGGGEEEFDLAAEIYPIYEEYEVTGKILPRIKTQLRYLRSGVRRVEKDPYESLRLFRYFEDKFDPVLGMTEEGRKQGFWAPAYVKEEARKLLSAVKLSENSFKKGGVILDGRYATINFHPAVADEITGINFKPGISGQYMPMWKPTPEDPNRWEMIPGGSLLGRPLATVGESLLRPARRLADHDPASYINDGFDELQVYWAVNQMFDSLRPMGFTDPDLSTRRFHAYLYDPDIAYRDNAYYTDDTINFTTYSAKSSNMARDNTTIWHELGHGVMDRLMGDYIRLADTGGLSEGMADFVAQLVLQDVTKGEAFEGKESMRIFNKTGFYLTNEVHDDGEAYGGVLNDMLEAALKTYGSLGLKKITDLTLDAMRLTRNHPALTAVDWFSHMLYADELGNAPLRAPGELKELLLSSLRGRNFNLDGTSAATFTLVQNGNEVTSTSLGSRENPIRLQMAPEESITYRMQVKLQGTPGYVFQYPVTVKVGLRGGPLQGAVHWAGEETEPLLVTLNSEAEVANFDLTASGTCDAVNQGDGSCKDFAYVQIWSAGEKDKPQAKKRFYLRIKTQ